MTPLRLNDFFWFSESRPIILLRQFETTMLFFTFGLKLAKSGTRLLRLQTASRVRVLLAYGLRVLSAVLGGYK